MPFRAWRKGPPRQMGTALHGKWKLLFTGKWRVPFMANGRYKWHCMHSQPSVRRQSTHGSVQGTDEVCSHQLHADQRLPRWQTKQLPLRSTLRLFDWHHRTDKAYPTARFARKQCLTLHLATQQAGRASTANFAQKKNVVRRSELT